MGKRKVTDKDIRSIEFAIDSVFPGASGEAAKQAFHVLVERAEETGKLQNDLNSLRHELNTHSKANIKRFPIATVSSVSSAMRWHVRRLSMRTGSPSCSATFCMVRMGVHGLFSDRVANVGYLSAGRMSMANRSNNLS